MSLFHLKLGTVGKIFLAGAAAWIAGRASKLMIRGTPQEVDALADALRASRRFNEIGSPVTEQ